eukprot:CAMPEP_0197529966 /NCGR_PEP_ID=MMETSP1318-20131121/30263_1 /TAXON_ID=552666 /ORGANISM="Partenskyella glossopodia, Strain RCC365" /LENGTH=209 /DNA_ID=CAMNT_0043085615 /DNA_START=196 /DNA_END=822 /DNA_ORIENTATION=-
MTVELHSGLFKHIPSRERVQLDHHQADDRHAHAPAAPGTPAHLSGSLAVVMSGASWQGEDEEEEHRKETTTTTKKHQNTTTSTTGISETDFVAEPQERETGWMWEKGMQVRSRIEHEPGLWHFYNVCIDRQAWKMSIFLYGTNEGRRTDDEKEQFPFVDTKTKDWIHFNYADPLRIPPFAEFTPGTSLMLRCFKNPNHAFHDELLSLGW